MAKRATFAEKLLAQIDARIAALRLQREELVAAIAATKTNKSASGPAAATE
jgi:hypothetical protein